LSLNSSSNSSPGASGGRLLTDEPAPGVARLTISNPDKRGALDQPLLDAIAHALPAIDARCVILTGQGSMFSAGYDIGDLRAGGGGRFAQAAERLVAHPFTEALESIAACPVPVLAALNGHAIGGGLELAVGCDLRIAADSIRLAMTPAKLGLVYSHTGIRTFIDTIGAARTRELFLVGGRIDAATALAWGLVNRLAPAERLAEAAVELAVELAANAPLSQRGNKRVIRAVLDARAALDDDVEQELIELRRACFASDDFREGVEAFGDKRPPQWRGR
jgi:enoyl-CoA hydratase/carnithine racemase